MRCSCCERPRTVTCWIVPRSHPPRGRDSVLSPASTNNSLSGSLEVSAALKPGRHFAKGLKPFGNNHRFASPLPADRYDLTQSRHERSRSSSRHLAGRPISLFPKSGARRP